jgi:hypothetical protein
VGFRSWVLGLSGLVPIFLIPFGLLVLVKLGFLGWAFCRLFCSAVQCLSVGLVCVCRAVVRRLGFDVSLLAGVLFFDPPVGVALLFLDVLPVPLGWLFVLALDPHWSDPPVGVALLFLDVLPVPLGWLFV